VQAVISGVILLVIQVNETANNAYQIFVDAGTILYFIPFLYMYAAAIKLAYRSDRETNPDAALIPGGKLGVWIVGAMGFAVVVFGLVLSFIPPAEATDKWLFEGKLIIGTVGGVLLGLILYYRGARAKSREAALSPSK
jgi:glutamate:GABA antiporter